MDVWSSAKACLDCLREDEDAPAEEDSTVQPEENEAMEVEENDEEEVPGEVIILNKSAA